MQSTDKILSKGEDWFRKKKWRPFPFQIETWKAYLDQKSGLLNAPTGSGKTYALWIPCLLEFLSNTPPEVIRSKPKGIQVLWITPLRALTRDIQSAMIETVSFYDLQWDIRIRTGDTSSSEKQKIKKDPPACLITTPESLHLMLSQKNYRSYFRQLKTVIIDEWHELLSTKRAVQVELALSHIKKLTDGPLKIWGISATIGNLNQAARVLTGEEEPVIIKADFDKKTEIRTIFPDQVEKFPWSGFLGIKLLDKVMPVIRNSRTTLLFTNTRSQTEIWYQKILNSNPDMAGWMAMHHGSLDQEVRLWVENALHEGKLKLVVCTSSLDLGVDFRPVDTVIQVGSPRGVARFFQRAGRSGHQPGEISRIYFVPTHSLEMIEGAALRTALSENHMEERKPLEKSLDVLIQYLVTLATGDGFYGKEILKEIRQTYSFRNLTDPEWEWALFFITTGGQSLTQYEEFSKVKRDGDLFYIENRKMITRHRLSIGTIVGDPILKVRYVSGGMIGTIEESFIAKLKKGDTFWFAGRSLEFIRLKDMTAYVRKSTKKRGLIPQWMGGRMPLSSKLSELIRRKLDDYAQGDISDPELEKMIPLLQLQHKWSIIPDRDTLLIEKMKTREGFHTFIYPFEGRYVHEVLAALLAHRLGKILPNSFSIGMNDYGFELLSPKDYDLEKAIDADIFSNENLFNDIKASINQTEMAKRRFRDIAAISGLVFKGYPGKFVSQKHIQASSQILFEVFAEYDPDNLLIRQALEEVISLQLEQSRLLDAMKRINHQVIRLIYPPKPTPFAFPIMADRLREKLTSEKLIDRIGKMALQLEKFSEKN